MVVYSSFDDAATVLEDEATGTDEEATGIEDEASGTEDDWAVEDDATCTVEVGGNTTADESPI